MLTPGIGGQLARVAAALEHASGRADDALKSIRADGARDLPSIRSLLDDARGALSSVDDDLADQSWPLANARAAAERLEGALGPVRRARSRIGAPQLTEPLADAIDGAREASRRLRMVQHDEAAVARGSMPAWLAPDAPPTKADSTAELERILAKPNGQVTDDELWRVALIDALPERVRPAVPPRSPIDAPLERLVTKPDISDRIRPNAPLKVWADRELNRLRLAVEAPLYAADPDTTVASAVEELARMLARTDLGDEELRRIALVAHLPDALRPDLPTDLVRSMQRAYVHGFSPRTQLVSGIQFKALREHMLARYPEAMTATIRSHVDTGLPFSHDFVSPLATLDDRRLAEFGLTRELLLARTLRMVGEGRQDIGWGREPLLAARDIAAGLQVDAALQPMVHDLRTRLDEAIDLVERQIRRRPEMPATNALLAERWPDFGDLGRMASTAELLATMRSQGHRTIAAAESLAW